MEEETKIKLSNDEYIISAGSEAAKGFIVTKDGKDISMFVTALVIVKGGI